MVIRSAIIGPPVIDARRLMPHIRGTWSGLGPKKDPVEQIPMVMSTMNAPFRPAIRAANGTRITPTREAPWVHVLYTETRVSQPPVCVPAIDFGRNDGSAS